MEQTTTVNATPEELELRYELIELLVTQGLQKRHVVQWAREKSNWGISDRQVRNYYDTVMERMSQRAGKVDRRFYHVRSLGRLDYIYRTAIEAGDRKHALLAEREIIGLLHLDDPAHEMTWREVAEKAGLNPDGLLEFMLQQHTELEPDAIAAD